MTNMKGLRQIPVSDVSLGKNWKVLNVPRPFTSEYLESAAELVESSDFAERDFVIYSALIAFPSGRVQPLLVFKEVGDASYGGATWGWGDGKWRESGLEPNPDYELGGLQFFAAPLKNDPSFNALDHDYREHNRVGFKKYAAQMK